MSESRDWGPTSGARGKRHSLPLDTGLDPKGLDGLTGEVTPWGDHPGFRVGNGLNETRNEAQKPIWQL